MKNVLKHWYDNLKDKISKDKYIQYPDVKNTDGELYYDFSDVKSDYVLTFKQFVHFLTKVSQTPNGKVSYLIRSKAKYIE